MAQNIENNPGPSDIEILRGEVEDTSEVEENEETPKPRKEVPDTREEDDDDEEEQDTSENDETDDEDSDDDDSESDDEVGEEEFEDNDDERVGAPFHDRPTLGQLKKEFPELLKKYPGLRSTFYREKAYTEAFPTVEDAKEAASALVDYRNAEQVLSRGRPEDYLDILGGMDKNQGTAKERQFIQSFLPALRQRNPAAHQAIVEPVVRGLFRKAYEDAKRNGNDNLAASIENVNFWAFNSYDVNAEPPKQPVPENQVDPEKEQLKNTNQRLLQTQERNFINESLESGSKRLSKVIEQWLPPDLDNFRKEAITEKVFKRLSQNLGSDASHRSNMTRLIKQAGEAGYSKESKDRVVSAYLSRAKQGLQQLVKEIRSEALKGQKPSKPIPRRPTGTNGSVPKRTDKVNEDKAKAVQKGTMSERAFLES